MNIFEYVERNAKGEELVGKTEACETCGNLTDHDFCLYWKKTLTIIDGSKSFGLCSGKTEKKVTIIPVDIHEDLQHTWRLSEHTSKKEEDD